MKTVIMGTGVGSPKNAVKNEALSRIMDTTGRPRGEARDLHWSE